MAITGLIATSLAEQSASGKWLKLFSPYIYDTDGCIFPEQGSSHARSNAILNSSSCVWKFTFKSFCFHIRNMHDLAVNNGSPRNRATTKRLSDLSDRSPRERSVLRRSSQSIAVDVIDDRILRFCNLRSVFSDGFQHRWRSSASGETPDFTRHAVCCSNPL